MSCSTRDTSPHDLFCWQCQNLTLKVNFLCQENIRISDFSDEKQQHMSASLLTCFLISSIFATLYFLKSWPIFDKLLFFDFFRVCWFWSNASRFKKLASFIKNFARIYYTLLCFSMLHKCSHANGQTRKNVIETFLIVTHQKTNSSHHLTWTSEPWGGSGAKFFTTINTET